MHVVVMQSVAGESVIASVYTQDREWVMYLFAGLYILILCLVGGKQGLKGSLGLIFTFFCIIFVYLPMIYRGISPFWTAVFVCVITTIVTMYLIGDRTPDFDEVYDKINEILEEKLNCSLKVEFLSWGEHDTKYSLLFSSR